MKRYIAQFVPWSGGQYAVLDTDEGYLITEPKPYHEANDEAEEKNRGATRTPPVSIALYDCN